MLDIYKREAITPQNLASLAFAGNPDTRRGQAPDKTQLTEQGGKLKAERIGAFALARLRIGPDDSAIGIFEVFPRLLPSVIVLRFYNGNT